MIAPIRRETGVALVKVLLLSTVVLVLATFAARATRIEVRISHNDLLAEQAFSVAEAGIHDVFSRIKNTGNPTFTPELQNGGTGGAIASLGTASGGDRFVTYPTGSTDGYYVHIENNDDEIGASTSTDADHAVKIRSRGTVGTAERQIVALVVKDPAFGQGLCGRDSVTIGGGSITDSYNSSAGAYGGSNVGSNGNVCSNGEIELNGSGTTVNGDASTHANIDPGQGSITGLQEENRNPAYTFPPVQPPCGGSYSNGAGISGGTYRTSGGNAGELSGTGQDAIVLANGTYCLKSVTLTGGATLTVNGPVQIYLTDPSRLEGGGVINTTGIPVDLQIYSTYDSANNNPSTGLTIGGGSTATMVVDAPDTDIVLASNVAHYFGAIVGSNVTLTGNTQFHYDEALNVVVRPDARIASWKEIRFE